MHLGSGENFVTLDFPFGFNSQEKYGTTSSATSKSETANRGEERESDTERRGMVHAAPVYPQSLSPPSGK